MQARQATRFECPDHRADNKFERDLLNPPIVTSSYTYNGCRAVTEPREADEVQQLREQVVELTQRVFRLEQILEGGASAEFSQDDVHYPTMQLDNLPEPMVSEPSPAVPEPVPEEQTGPLFAEAPEPPPPLPVMKPPVGAPARLPLVHPVAQSQLEPTSKPEISLESRIGGQWLNRIGIVAVLVGLSYFLKLAFDNNWIGPPVRVGIGIGIGVLLLLWSERFRSRGFSGFAYSLKAIAFGAFYLSLWAAFQFYHLIPATVAFGAMVAVTVLAAILSLRQNSELLAAFALVGGFLTPVLLSTGQNQEAALFGYLVLLDLGALWIVAIKGWRRILLGSFVGTAILFAGWASSYYTAAQMPLTLGFASFFFVLYALTPFLGGVDRDQQHRFSVVALVLLNAASYFAASYAMLYEYHRDPLAWLTAALAAFFFILSLAMRKREHTAKPLLEPLYLALAVIFLTIAIPLELDGRWITFAWTVEAAVLFLASQRSNRDLLRVFGVSVLGLAVLRLVLLESDVTEPLLVNPRFALYLLAIAVLALLAYITISDRSETNRQWAGGAIIAINLIALAALHFEVTNYFQPRLNAIDISVAERRNIYIVFDFTYSAIWMVYGSALMLIGFWKRSAFLRWQAIVLLALTVAKVFLSDISALDRGYRIAAFIVLGLVLLVVSYFYQRSRVKAAI